jgi:cytochrome c oxidase subunit 2
LHGVLAQTAIFPRQATTIAAEVDALFWFLISVCGFVGLLVAVLMIYYCIRYRRRPGDPIPPVREPSRVIEWSWTISPLFIFAIMFFWGAAVYLKAYRPEGSATRVYGIGKQWMWKFQHPEGQREINSLHLPIGQPVQLLLTSEDVIHSFFVPEFRVHMDVLPNRYTSVAFRAVRPGTYHLFCSQYCGTDHAGMIGTVTVMEPADYEAWLAGSAEGSLALEGRKVFLKYRCISCHEATAGGHAPVLEGVFNRPVRLSDGREVIADEDYIHESILEPSAKVVAGWQNIMPTFRGQITEEEIYALIAFLQSLGPGATPPRVENYPPPITTPEIERPEPQ